jgi:predicted Zn-dependent peptidase
MKFTKTVLDNGLRIITAPQKDNPAVTVLVLVETGSKYETKDINGISHFLEHMCFKGTKNRPTAMAISTELDSIGAIYNAFTEFEYTGYFAKTDRHYLDKALDVVSDIYLNQVFDADEIDKERGVIIEELNMYEDLPMRRVEYDFVNLLYGDQPAGWDIGGRKEVIRTLTRDNFIDYHRDHYVASATVVIVAGAIDKKEILEKVKAAFRDISTGKKKDKSAVVEKQDEPKFSIRKKKSDQTHLILGARAYDLFHEKRYIADVLADILGGGMSSRLFQKVREEMGAAYYVRASTDQMTDHGFLAAAAGVDNKRFIDVVQAILGEFSRFRNEQVPEKELKKAKDHMVGKLMLGLETSDSLASFYGFQEALTKEVITPQELAEKIQKVTSDEIQEVANDIFQDSKLNLSVIGPVEHEKALQSILKIA